MLDVNTVSKYDKNFISLVREIQHFSSSISPADRHYENYTRRLNFTDSVAISTYRNKNTLIGFSTVLHLPVYDNGVRILNRFYKDPQFRMRSLKVTDETKIMINQQLSIAKSLNFDFAFMSRESNTNQFAMKHFAKQLDSNWNIMPNKYLVSSNSEQYIVVYPFKKQWNQSSFLKGVVNDKR
jgi:hypothetical protein